MLEQNVFSNLETVVLCPVANEMTILHEVLAHYFPRNKNEENLAFELPRLNINQCGEVVKEEKVVQVATRPGRFEDFNSIAYEIAENQDSEDSFKQFARVSSCDTLHINKKKPKNK